MPTPEEQKKLEEKLGEIATLTTDFQTSLKALEDEGKTNSEALIKMGEEIGKMSEELSTTKSALDAGDQAVKDLELLLARKSEVAGDDDAKSIPEYVKGFDTYLRTKQSIDPEHIEAEFREMVKNTGANISDDEMRGLKSMIVGSNPDGGFYAPTDMQSRIIKRVFETSPMRSVATVITTGAESVEFPVDDGEFSSGWVGELDDRPETDTSKIGKVTIAVAEQYAEPKASQKMLDDSLVNVEQYINGKLVNKFGRVENAAFVNGTGVKKPRGFQDYDAWATAGVYQRDALETRETVGSLVVDGDDLLNLQSDLLEDYQAMAKWGMQRKRWVEVLKLKDQNDQYLMNPAMLFGGSLGLQLLGKEVKIFGDMPDTTTPTAGDKVIVYGDFGEGYVIVDRIGIRILRDPYTAKGFVKFYTTKRTGGAVVNFQALKRLKLKA